ncbi:MAG: 6-carboxytetrahydropterin synthase QueD [Desulfomonilia bacterium]
MYYVQPMFRAKVVESFSAAHRLTGYQGDCERLHGHNYRVEVTVQSDTLDSVGVVMDFRDLKNLLKLVLDEFDHQYLNDLDVFRDENPSAENIARIIFSRLSEVIPHPVILSEVLVWENENCCVAYSLQGPQA